MHFTDTERLDWMLAQFYTADNAWHATFCFDTDKAGLRAQIDSKMLANTTLDRRHTKVGPTYINPWPDPQPDTICTACSHPFREHGNWPPSPQRILLRCPN